MAVVTEKEFKKIADVVRLATPGRYSVSTGIVKDNVRVIAIFDTDSVDHELIAYRYFTIGYVVF